MEHEERLKAALADRYQIEREIGSGGMATVYLAGDLKHDRKVAVKVLKPELAAVVGTERFLAEIRTTANLNHAHILPLFDSGEADGFLFYVMPHVEGESLRQRLDRDGQLPVEEAVRIAGHVADALDYAHQQGVIHRDIKPGNILFQAGDPVVTDFGISLAITAAGEGRLTETGLSLGTPYYMSPEQAAGDQTATAASDVYSLGCVLYEMLTGDPPHTGSSAQAILGKILLGEVTRPTKLRRTIPANVEAVLLKALERLPADRFESASELAAALKEKAFRHGAGVAAPNGRWNTLNLGLAGMALTFGLLALWLGMIVLAEEPSPGHVVRVRLPLLEEHSFVSATGTDMDLSPDGARLAYIGTDGAGGRQLWHRPLDEFDPSPLRGTGSASNPVFSPDGGSVAFIAEGTLKTTSLLAGEPSPVGPTDVQPNGLEWGGDGFLYFTDTAGAIQRVPATGGQAEVFAAPKPGFHYSAPALLPGSKGLLVTINGEETGRGPEVGIVPRAGGEARSLFPGTMARFLPPDVLLVSTGSGELMGVDFDLARMEPTSDLVLLVTELAGVNPSFSEFAVSETGDLVYRIDPGDEFGEVVWVSREGAVEEVDPDWHGVFRYPRLSPDGRRLAIEQVVEAEYTLWVRDLERGANQRLEVDRGAFRSSWSPDGRFLTFRNRGAGLDLWTTRADGTGEPELLLDRPRALFSGFWSQDAQWLIFQTGTGESGAGDILALPADLKGEPISVATTDYQELSAALSPNGSLVAYASTETGRSEVYVAPFPDVQDWRRPVSANGGWEPVWSRNGKELFFRNGDNEMVSVGVETTQGVSLGRETILFSAVGLGEGGTHPNYDVTVDGQSFIMVRSAAGSGLGLVLVAHFIEEVKAKLGG